jgi:hypothetical protein
MRHNLGQVAGQSRSIDMQAAQVAKLLGGEEVLGCRIGNELELEIAHARVFPLPSCGRCRTPPALRKTMFMGGSFRAAPYRIA